VFVSCAYYTPFWSNVLIGQAAELPNIKGGLGVRPDSGTPASAINGAFYKASYANTGWYSGASGAGYLQFEAAKGQVNADGSTFVSQDSSVYKNGGEVRSQNLAVKYWKRTA